MKLVLHVVSRGFWAFARSLEQKTGAAHSDLAEVCCGCYGMPHDELAVLHADANQFVYMAADECDICRSIHYYYG